MKLREPLTSSGLKKLPINLNSKHLSRRSMRLDLNNSLRLQAEVKQFGNVLQHHNTARQNGRSLNHPGLRSGVRAIISPSTV